MKKNLLTMMALVGATVLSFTACKKDDNNNNGNTAGSATMSMRLTDGPADYDHIWLDIKQVEVTMSGSNAVVLTPVNPGLYDILQFKNGLDTTLLSQVTVPAGTVQQIRLILGENNSIVVDGASYPLSTPSAQESGVKLNLHETFAAGGSYNIWLDFDAAKSILQTGNGAYKLKPVIRAYSNLTNGRITGFIMPLNAMATVYAINGSDTLSAIPNANGYFMFSGLPEGTYQILVEPGLIGLQPYTMPNVQVSYGVATEIGTITLP